MFEIEYYLDFEKKFKVNYPKKDGATYSSPLNFSDDLSLTKQRWYRYKEGFSLGLIENILNEYSDKDSNGIILDPFVGSGTTIIGSNLFGKTGYGFEVNPFTAFLADLKIKKITKKQAEMFKRDFEIMMSTNLDDIKEYPLPPLSFAAKIFNPDIRVSFMKYRTLIDTFKEPSKSFLLLGWLSILEEISNYRKAGNGLKIRKTKKERIVNVKSRLLAKYTEIENDLFISPLNDNYNNKIFNDSSMNMSEYLKDNSIEGAIFSPPYANCFDYTEIYKLELWFGGFIKNRDDLRKLRKTALRSNLNSCAQNYLHSTSIVDSFISQMDETLWDERIPFMLRGYFDDMFTVLDNLFNKLQTNGFCCIVVGNSTYGGVVVPTDLILAEYASSIGFKVDKIEVDRFIIPSSQQYNRTKKYSKFIRESVVCLKK